MALGIVQAASHAYKYDGSTTTPQITWGSAPTNGNLMIVEGFRWTNAPVPANGWQHAVVPSTNGTVTRFCMFKYAGASEPSTVVIDTAASTAAWGINAWEIGGVSGHFWKDVIKITLPAIAQFGAGTSLIPSSAVTTKPDTTLALISVVGYSSNSGLTFSWSQGTASSNFETTTVDASNGLLDYGAGASLAVGTPTSINPTVTTNSSAFWLDFAVIELGSQSLGPDSVPAVGTASGVSVSSVAAALTSFGAGDVIFAVIAASTFALSLLPTPSVTGVAATGLTFTKRFQANPAGLGAQNAGDLEVWTAPASSAFSGTITASLSGATGANNSVVMTAFAIGGCSNISSPWDSHSGLPASGTTSASWDTTQFPDKIIGIGANYPVGPATTPVVSGGPTWTLLNNNGLQSGSASAALGIYLANEASAASSQTTTISVGELTYVDALTAGGTNTETGNVSMALSGMSFNVAANDASFTRHVSLGLTKMSFNIAEARKETTAATLAMKPMAINAAADRKEAAVVTMSLNGVKIAASTFDLNSLNPVRQFSTFG